MFTRAISSVSTSAWLRALEDFDEFLLEAERVGVVEQALAGLDHLRPGFGQRLELLLVVARQRSAPDHRRERQRLQDAHDLVVVGARRVAQAAVLGNLDRARILVGAEIAVGVEIARRRRLGEIALDRRDHARRRRLARHQRVEFREDHLAVLERRAVDGRAREERLAVGGRVERGDRVDELGARGIRERHRAAVIVDAGLADHVDGKLAERLLDPRKRIHRRGEAQVDRGDVLLVGGVARERTLDRVQLAEIAPGRLLEIALQAGGQLLARGLELLLHRVRAPLEGLHPRKLRRSVDLHHVPRSPVTAA